MSILEDLHATSREFTAEAHLLAGATPAERSASLEQICNRHGIEHPFILKPDIGQRGAASSSFAVRSRLANIWTLPRSQSEIELSCGCL